MTGRNTDRFAPALLRWFGSSGRHDLPWQKNRTLYRVWVSEIMLQQTQVGTVIPYFEKFMTRFPTVAALASAPLDEVLHAWAGLGYYARARNLHRAAIRVMQERSGEMPAHLDALLELPGIGRSTAGAILSLSLGQRHAILDGNVKRVLSRWFGVGGQAGSVAFEKRLWSLSEEVTPAADSAAYTQAIMDLGATVCTRHQPKCGECPVKNTCVAFKTRNVDLYPPARARPKRQSRRVWWLIVTRSEHIYLAQRASEGIWGGLWAFPEFESHESLKAFIEGLPGSKRLAAALKPLPVVTHAFTHFELQAHPVHLGVDRDLFARSRLKGRWLDSGDLTQVGMPKPISVLVDRLI